MLIAFALLIAAPVRAGDRDVLAPFRFSGDASEMTAVERQRAQAYRSLLQDELRALDQDDLRGRLDPLEWRHLLESRSELERMDEALAPQRSGGLGIPGRRTLPSLSGRSPLVAP